MARTKQPARKKGNPRRSATSATAAAPASPSPTSPVRRKTVRATPPNSRGVQKKKSWRYRPGTVALQEIRRFQKSADLVIPAAPFVRTVREISNFNSSEVTRWTSEALHAIQVAAEDFLVHLFEDAMLCAIHAKRVTLMKKDFELARRLGGKGQPW